MAFYESNRNKNFTAGASKEPAYGGVTNHPNHMQRPMMLYKDGEQHAIVGHFVAHNSQSYVLATQEDVIKFGSGDDREHSPSIKEVYMDHGTGNLSPYSPRSSTKNADSLSRELHHPGVYSRTKASPIPDSFLKDKSPPLRNHHYFNASNYGKYNYLSSNDEKNDEADPSHTYKTDAYSKEMSYDKENNKTYGYAPSNYTNSYHDKTSYNDNNEKHNGNISGYAHAKVKNIPQIRTRTGDPEFAKDNRKNLLKFASPERQQGYQEVIDSSEARRRYSGGQPTWAGQYVEEMYEGIIDCREAARKYNGVFVSK